MSRQRIPDRLQPWAEARQRLHLSDAHIQMARELGLNPRKLGSLANHDQESWKAPLPQFIARLYLERFGRDRPAVVRSIEEVASVARAKKERACPVDATARSEYAAERVREMTAPEGPALGRSR